MVEIQQYEYKGMRLHLEYAKPLDRKRTFSKDKGEGCYRCGVPGHISRDCPNPTPMPRNKRFDDKKTIINEYRGYESKDPRLAYRDDFQAPRERMRDVVIKRDFRDEVEYGRMDDYSRGRMPPVNDSRYTYIPEYHRGGGGGERGDSMRYMAPPPSERYDYRNREYSPPPRYARDDYKIPPYGTGAPPLDPYRAADYNSYVRHTPSSFSRPPPPHHYEAMFLLIDRDQCRHLLRISSSIRIQ